MVSPELYELADKIRKSGIQKKLGPEQIFGVKLPDGQIGYCSVVADGGTDIQISVYVGESGLENFRKLFSSAISIPYIDLTENEKIMEGLAIECLSLNFLEKKELEPEDLEEYKQVSKETGLTFRGKIPYPKFLKHEPYCMSYEVFDPKDEEILISALSAVLEVANRLNSEPPKIKISDEPPYMRSIPILEKRPRSYKVTNPRLDDGINFDPNYPQAKLSRKRMSSLKKADKSGEMELELYPLPFFSAPDEKNAHKIRIPVAVFAIYSLGGQIYQSALCVHYPDDVDSTVDSFFKELLNNLAVPKRISVSSYVAEAVLKNICDGVGIELELYDELPHLDPAIKELFARMEKSVTDKNFVDNMLSDILEISGGDVTSMPKDVKKFVLPIIS